MKEAESLPGARNLVLVFILHPRNKGRSQARKMNRGAVEDLCSALSSIHGGNVRLLIVGVDLGDADLWETGDFESIVRVPDHLGSGLVKRAHARGEFGLECII